MARVEENIPLEEYGGDDFATPDEAETGLPNLLDQDTSFDLPRVPTTDEIDRPPEFGVKDDASVATRNRVLESFRAKFKLQYISPRIVTYVNNNGHMFVRLTTGRKWYELTAKNKRVAPTINEQSTWHQKGIPQEVISHLLDQSLLQTQVEESSAERDWRERVRNSEREFEEAIEELVNTGKIDGEMLNRANEAVGGINNLIKILEKENYNVRGQIVDGRTLIAPVVDFPQQLLFLTDQMRKIIDIDAEIKQKSIEITAEPRNNRLREELEELKEKRKLYLKDAITLKDKNVVYFKELNRISNEVADKSIARVILDDIATDRQKSVLQKILEFLQRPIVLLGLAVSGLIASIFTTIFGGGGHGNNPAKKTIIDDVKDWVKDKLNKIADLLKKLALKIVDAIPGMIGSLLSWILNRAADAFTFLAEHLWILLIAGLGATFTFLQNKLRLLPRSSRQKLNSSARHARKKT